jgi:1-acyl-sn-glycerol-3-phosphate acyltransferase
MDNVTRPLANFFAPTTVRGVEHLRHVEGPVIFVANHQSHLDTPVLLTALPVRFRHRVVVAAAADYFFDRRWKANLWAFALAAIPIERTKVNRQSGDVAAELLGEGWNLVIYPEGGRSPDGWIQPFRGGAAYLAKKVACTVVPVHVRGTRHVLPKSAGKTGGFPLKRSPVTVIFGTPMRPDEGEDARRFGARIEASVAALADESTSDWWQARRRAAQGSTPDPRGPDAAPWRRAWALGAPPSPAAAKKRWPYVN